MIRRFPWLMLAGCGLAFCAAMLALWEKRLSPPREAMDRGGRGEPIIDRLAKDRSEWVAPRAAPGNRVAVAAELVSTKESVLLQQLCSSDDLQGIHGALERLADLQRLNAAGGLLKKWCREERLEIVQWCLLFAEDSDPQLHLALCVETLSNPTEAMRELALSRLEEAAGAEFSNPAEAKAWVAEHAPP